MKLLSVSSAPRKCWQLIVSGLMSLFLLLSLTSCATVAMPPAKYLKDCTISYPRDGTLTNGDVVRLAQDRKTDVQLCNVDKAALRAWYEGYAASKGWRWKVRKE